MKKLTAIFLFAGLVLFLPAVHAQQTYVSGQVGIGVPSGEFADSYGLGLGGSANFLYNLVEENLWITGSLGYTRFTYSSDRTTNRSGNWSTIPLLGSIRYQLSRGNYRFYVGGEAGLHFISRSITEVKIAKVDERIYSTSETAFGVGFLGGFFYPLSNVLTIDATLTYRMLLNEDAEDGSGYLNVMIGVMYPISL